MRSDTVTRPTEQMRRAIATAAVDDDCYGTDPTANALESEVAKRLGKEAAVFTVTGTMANVVAVGAQSRMGDEILYESKAHPINYEAGAPSANLGVQTTGIPTDDGLLDPDIVKTYFRERTMHQPDTVLLSVENTHNAAGGTVYPLDQLHALAHIAHEHDIRAHLDGARLWNAAVQSGYTEAELCAPYDTVSVCFSKGLGAPIGSALAGDKETIARARKLRRRLGGGWRQAGVVAAGALYAMQNHRDRLVEDHVRAKQLADGIADIAELTTISPQTNILMVETHHSSLNAKEWSRQLVERGVLQKPVAPNRFRLVTHLGVNDDDISFTIEQFHAIASKL